MSDEHMNNGSGDSKPGIEEERDDICRDFLKNVCFRGDRCKFYHPKDAPVPKEDVTTDINFCIDFQNRGCMRDNCRFVHAAREDAERFKHTREVTLPLARAIAAVSHGDIINGIPVCKEFQVGKCSRGAQRCRYWHVNLEEERDRRRRGMPPSGGPPPMRGPPGPGGPPGRFAPPPWATPGPGMRRPAPDAYDMDVKRARMDDQRVSELERRNGELMKEVEGLKRELQRERERYEDLYTLFRNQTTAPAATHVPQHGHGHSAHNAPAYQQHHQPHSSWSGAQWSQ